MGHCSGYSAITRNYIGSTSWELRHRTGYNSNGTGIHGGQHNEHINSTFAVFADSAFLSLNVDSNLTVDWVGDVGIGACKSGYHGQARAFDVTQVRFTNGSYFDMNYSWRQAGAHRRGYLGVAAECRRHVSTVLTAWYNSLHHNHIHFDNGAGSGLIPIRTNMVSDTTLVQAACNYLNGESLAIDGAWGPLTEAAYNRLRADFNISCLNPKTNGNHAGIFLRLIAQHGLNNKSAGYYQASSC